MTVATVSLAELFRDDSWVPSSTFRGALVARVGVDDVAALQLPDLRAGLDAYLTERRRLDGEVTGLLVFLIEGDGRTWGYLEIRGQGDGPPIWDGPHASTSPR